MCSEYACVHLRCTAAARCPLRISGAWGNLQGGGKEPWFCCSLCLILGTAWVFLECWALGRGASPWHDFLIQISVRETWLCHFSVNLHTIFSQLFGSCHRVGQGCSRCASLLPLAPASWLYLCPLLTLGYSCLLGPLIRKTPSVTDYQP